MHIVRGSFSSSLVDVHIIGRILSILSKNNPMVVAVNSVAPPTPIAIFKYYPFNFLILHNNYI